MANENFKETENDKLFDEDCEVEDGKAKERGFHPIKFVKKQKEEHPALFAGAGLAIMSAVLLVVYFAGKKASADEQIFIDDDLNKIAKPDDTPALETSESTENPAIEEDTLVSYNTEQ